MNGDTDAIRTGLSARAAELAMALMGKPVTRTKRELRFGSRENLSIAISGSKSGRWFDHRTAEGGDMLSLIQRQRGGDWKATFDYARSFLGSGFERQTQLPVADDRAAQRDEARRIRFARRLWAESVPAKATIVETYLKSRAIETLPESVRYHRARNAMIVAAKNTAGNIQAVQMTFLTADGRKRNVAVPRKAHGVLKGASVHLQEGKGATIIVEGVETGLSAVLATTAPVVAVLGAANFKHQRAANITLVGDGDAPDSPAAAVLTKAAETLRAAGSRVRVVRPDGQDLNDILQAHGIRGVRNALDPTRRAQDELNMGVAVWFDAALAFEGEAPTHLGIAAAAGLGKTRAAQFELARRPEVRERHIEVYASNHALASEWAANLVALAPDLNVQIIRGREQKDQCQKSELAAEVARQGLPVQSSLCLRDGKACEHFQTCPYQQQFRDDRPAIRIMPHQYLTLDRHPNQPAPSLAIIDEKFFDTAIRSTSFGIDRLTSYRPLAKAKTGDALAVMDMAKIARDAFEDDRPLVDALKAAKVTDDDLAMAMAVEATGIEESPVTPDMSATRQRQALDRFQQFESAKLWRFWKIIGEEFSASHVERVTYRPDIPWRGERQSRLFMTWRRDIRVAGVPTLVLDADLDEEIAGKFLPGIKVQKIDAPRNAEVTQVTDTACSRTRLLSFDSAPDRERTRAARRLQDVQRLIDREAQAGKLLVVATKRVAERLTVSNGEVSWFGAIRGIDRWKDFDSVLIVGREQPRADAVEATAAALWWDRPEPLKRHAGGAWTTHPDADTHRLVEQIREAEMVQAVDRIRLIHATDRKRVIILSNLDLGLDVAHHATWRELVPDRFERARTDGVELLSPAELSRCFPDMWGTPKAAKRAIEEKRLRGPKPLIDIPLGKWGLFVVSYRLPNQGSGKPYIARISGHHRDPRVALQTIVGPIVYFEVLEAPDGADVECLNLTHAIDVERLAIMEHDGKIVELLVSQDVPSPELDPPPEHVWNRAEMVH